MSGNTDQIAFWSGDPGKKWVTFQPILDRLFAEATDALFAGADVRPGQRVLDIGCGAGDVTVRAADLVGPEGHALGVDVSPPLVDHARRRAEGYPNADFALGDAQVHPFETGGFDRVISRFGVMFFEDPVAAFRNMHRALAPGGTMCLLGWAAQAENPWSQIARDAGVAQLGAPAPEPPGTTGQFAFADLGWVVGLIEAGGFAGVTGEVVDIRLHIDGDARQAAHLATTIGPVARIMNEYKGTEADRVAIADVVEDGFRAFETADGVRIPALLTRFIAAQA